MIGLVAIGLLLGAGRSAWAQQEHHAAAMSKQFGELESISKDSLTIRTESGEAKTFKLSSDAKILLNGRRSAADDLKRGDDVSLRFKKDDPGTALSLHATREMPERAAARRETRESREVRRPAEAERPSLGVIVQETRDKKGVDVLEVRPDSPAEKAGIHVGDKLLSINDQNLDTPAKLSDILGHLKVGDSLNLKIVRDGKEEQLKAVLAKRSEIFGRIEELREEMRQRRESRRESFDREREEFLKEAEKHPWIGLFLDKTSEEKGVEILNVFPNGPADKGGLKKGDVVLKINTNEVNDPRDVIEILEGLKPGDTVSLTIKRETEEKTLDVKMGNRAQFLREAPQQLREDMRFGRPPELFEGREPETMVLERQALEETERNARLESLGQQLLDELQGLRHDVQDLKEQLKTAPQK
jgi:predicted metalloprotease with PDZ domain